VEIAFKREGISLNSGVFLFLPSSPDLTLNGWFLAYTVSIKSRAVALYTRPVYVHRSRKK